MVFKTHKLENASHSCLRIPPNISLVDGFILTYTKITRSVFLILLRHHSFTPCLFLIDASEMLIPKLEQILDQLTPFLRPEVTEHFWHRFFTLHPLNSNT